MSTTSIPRLSSARIWLASGALAAYFAAVLLATMWPTPLDQGYEASINRLLDVLHRNGVPGWFGYTKLEFGANVAMFLPIGLLVTMLLPLRVWWLAFLICPLLSAGIELLQGALLSSRFASVTDVVSNSSGALVGILIAIMVRAVIVHRDEKLIANALALAGVR